MYSLVKFGNDEFYITQSSKVTVTQGDNCLVKYKNSGKYDASLIAIDNSRDKLWDLSKQLESKIRQKCDTFKESKANEERKRKNSDTAVNNKLKIAKHSQSLPFQKESRLIHEKIKLQNKSTLKEGHSKNGEPMMVTSKIASQRKMKVISSRKKTNKIILVKNKKHYGDKNCDIHQHQKGMTSSKTNLNLTKNNHNEFVARSEYDKSNEKTNTITKIGKKSEKRLNRSRKCVEMDSPSIDVKLSSEKLKLSPKDNATLSNKDPINKSHTVDKKNNLLKDIIITLKQIKYPNIKLDQLENLGVKKAINVNDDMLRKTEVNIDNSTDDEFINVPNHSTPLTRVTPLFHHDLRISEIVKRNISNTDDEIKAAEQSTTSTSDICSSLPPGGMSDLLEHMGDSWPENTKALKDNYSINVNEKLSEKNFDVNPTMYSTQIGEDNRDQQEFVKLYNTDYNDNFKEDSYLVNKETNIDKRDDTVNFIHSSTNEEADDELSITASRELNDDFNENFVSGSTDPGNEKIFDVTEHVEIDPETSIDKSGNTTNDPNYTPDTTKSVNKSQTKSMTSITTSDVSYSAPPLDARKLKVPCSKVEGTKSTKKDFCMYCKKLITKLPRHLKEKHKAESRVIEFLSITKGMARRRQLINKIRKEGNFIHNTNPEYNTGVLITCRQQQAKYGKTAEDYVVCHTCRGSYSKKTIRIHHAKCNINHRKGSKHINVQGRRLEGFIHPEANNILRKYIIPVMNDDKITRLIKYDELIILMGNKFTEKYIHNHQHDLIRSQLRLLGRLKLCIMEKKADFDELSSMFDPDMYDTVVNAVREVSGYDPKTQSFKTPAVASNLGTLIKKCGEKWDSWCTRKKNKEKAYLLSEFFKLYRDEFPTTINKKVLEDQIKKKRTKKIVLPHKKDIQTLYRYLLKLCDKSMNILKKNFEMSAWKSLSEASLILLQMFNRRRAGEIERVEIADFNNKESVDEKVNPDLYSKLSETSRKLAQKYVRISIRGKLGRTVPALLDYSLVQYLQTIIDHRKEAGVKKSNPYLFGIPTSNSYSKKYLRACNLMRKFSVECGADMPNTLRGTTLRKHVATYTAMLGIEDNKVSDLANFMGHNKQIHKDIYRVPVPMRDVTDVSRLLQAAIGNDEKDGEAADSSSDGEAEDSDCDGDILCKSKSRQGNVGKTSDDYTDESESENSDETSKISTKSTLFGKTKRTRWTEQERDAIFQAFGDILKLPKLPSLEKCQQAIFKFSVLKTRTPQQMKTWIDNQRRAISRGKKSESNEF